MRSTALTWRAIVAAGCTALVMPTAGAAPAAPTAVPALEIVGRGFGHGVGMAQDGALSMGRAGASTPQILGHFYPGTKIGRASGNVRVPVLSAGSSGMIAFPSGGEIRDALDASATMSVRVAPGDSVAISYSNGRYQATPSGQVSAPGPSGSTTTSAPTTTTTTTAPAGGPNPVPISTTTTTNPGAPTSTTTPVSPSTTTRINAAATTTTAALTTAESTPAASSTRPLWAIPQDGGTVSVPARGRAYRGSIEATASGGALRFVNNVNVETYLKGMGEVRNPSWPAASLRTQAIAARTYALRAMTAGGELCDSQRCQVYLGAAAEYAAMNKAVNDTSGQVLYFGSTLASTVYSANGGGFSASREEGFGTTGSNYPYLRPSPYTTTDPASWKVIAPLREIGARLGYGGAPDSVEVVRRGPSGRALEVRLNGVNGPRSVSGLAFDSALGLKSTLFTLRVTTAVPEGSLGRAEQIQALPDDAAAAAAEAANDAAFAVPVLPRGPLFAAATRDVDARAVGGVLLTLALSALVLSALAIPAATNGNAIAAVLRKRWR
ncbi:MAG TPA: SpoIID/LytB domain-containing protein [Acidimicrobiales bacterium]|nr:SpoIID/LytB domain-containing protein [Acidimicrobiales bacterium]